MTSKGLSIRHQAVWIMMLPVLVVLAACGSPTGKPYTIYAPADSEYKTITVTKGIARFSFEYPSNYDLANVEVRTDLDYTDVVFSGPILEEEDDFTFLDVSVMGYRTSISSVEDRIEGYLSRVSNMTDFRLLERSSVSVASAAGEQVVFFYNRIRPPSSSVREPAHEITRSVFFECHKLLWEISMRSNLITSEADKADFKHILQTFKMLD